MNLAPLGLSFEVAVLATAMGTLVGVPIGTFLARPKTRGREFWDALVTAPLVLPPTVMGYYLLSLLGRSGPLGRLWEGVVGSPLVFTKAGAVVAAFVGGLPFIVRSSRTALEGVEGRYVQAARTLGASPLRAYATVHLPLALPGILSGMTLAFARSLGDFGVTLMVAGNLPGQTQTAALAIYDAIQAQNEEEAAQLALVLTLGCLACLLLVSRWRSRLGSQ